jgi:serine/threonine protein kinase
VGDLRTALADALGPIYRVEREVRPVGECRMFVAREVPAGPDLLVKVLPATLSLAADSSVFERELILLADPLGHPGLAPPKGVGRAASHIFHTRPFLEGTTLRAWLDRNGELPLARTVEILRAVLSALAHAHAAHLAHGDFRPENVVLTGGRPFVVDTGIVGALARSLTAGAADTVSATLCAPAYLAPERRTGGAPSALGDMFAVGVLVHEMLTGRPPTPEAEPLEEARHLPPWLRELVGRSLSPDPAARFADAGAALAHTG